VAAPVKKEWSAINNHVMKHPNRDLLYCLRNDYANEQIIEREVAWLHGMLRSVEDMNNFCLAHEVIDLNRYRISTKAAFIKRLAYHEISEKFLFLFNKN
jgi:hypothetical protein